MESDLPFDAVSCAEAAEGSRIRQQKRRDIDWTAIERDYCASALSLHQLAKKHGCAHSTIANYAGRHGWMRLHAESAGRSAASKTPQTCDT